MTLDILIILIVVSIAAITVLVISLDQKNMATLNDIQNKVAELRTSVDAAVAKIAELRSNQNDPAQADAIVASLNDAKTAIDNAVNG